ncbi:MAG: hypothetical protein AB1646_03215 [Thermodesulfobacteriota bacterium]
MKAIVALLVVLSAVLVATSGYAGDSQGATIWRRWKEVQKQQEAYDKHFKAIEEDMKNPFRVPFDQGIPTVPPPHGSRGFPR